MNVLQDLLTVMWKERKCMFRQSGGRGKTLLAVVAPIVMLGGVLPLQFTKEWLSSGWSLIPAVLIPLILIGIRICESFAGERERHTLPTLLASRLSDRAILFGKMVFGIVYGWLSALVLLLLSMGVVNALQWTGQIRFYDPAIAVMDIVLSLLTSVFVASLGILISLRCATAQGAQQTLMAVVFAPLMLLQVVPAVLLSVMPNGRDIIRNVLANTDFVSIVWYAIFVILALDVLLVLAAMARFKRNHLILDA